MRDYPHLAERLLNAPLLAHPQKAEIVAAVVLGRKGIDVTVEAPRELAEAAPAMGPLQERRLVRWHEEAGVDPFLFDEASGIAAIEVIGSLAHRQRAIGAHSGVMGYDWIAAQLEAALVSAKVKAIVLDVHSAGGEVAGAFQLADRIAAARRVKPIVAIADEMAFSAAYLLAAAAGEVWLASDVAQVGSIGVVWIHFSFETWLEREGVKPTIVQAGARKADANPFQDLPEEVRDLVQAKVDAVHDQFVARIAAWRGIGEVAVRATEAGIFMGAEASAAGLAEGIADPGEVLAALAAEINSPPALRAV